MTSPYDSPANLANIQSLQGYEGAQANLFAVAFECSCEAKMICDSTNKIIAVNQAFTEMTGYSSAEVMGKNPGILSSGRMSKDFYREMWASLEDKGTWSGELIERRKDGSTYPKYLTISAVWDDEHVAYYLASFIDITAMKEVHSRLEQLAHRDTLTGLLNRHSFDSILTQNIALARRKRERMGLLYLDLDGFKKVNDSLGHAVGDRVPVPFVLNLAVSPILRSTTQV